MAADLGIVRCSLLCTQSYGVLFHTLTCTAMGAFAKGPPFVSRVGSCGGGLGVG